MFSKASRIVAILLTLSFIAWGITSCGGNSNERNAANIKTSDIMDANIDEKVYTFTWTANQAAPIDSDPFIIDYFNKKLNVKIDVWNIDSAKYEDILSMKLASGEIPDLIKMNTYSAAQRYMSQGILASFNEDFVKKNAPNLYATYEGMVPGYFKKYGVMNGKNYYINNLKDKPYQNRPVPIYRGDWLKKMGYTSYPKTLKEFEEVMYKFANNDPDGNGKKDTYGLSYTGIYAVFGAFGFIPRSDDKKLSPVVRWQERDGKLVYTAIQPEIKEALAMLNKWFKDGVIDPEFITGENVGSKKIVSFMQGRIGFTCGGQWHLVHPDLDGDGPDTAATYYEELKKINPEAANNLVYGEPPVGPKGKSGLASGRTILETSIGFSVKLEKDPAKFAKLMWVVDNIMFKDSETMYSAVLGIKDKDWFWDKDGAPERFDTRRNNSDDAKEGGANTLTVLRSPKLTKDKVRNIKFIQDIKLDKAFIQDALNTALPSEGKYMSELIRLEDEAYVSIITGDKPIDYFEEFVKKWRAAGGSLLEKEANEWNYR